MKYCYQCGRITTGKPLYCNSCGRSYDVKLCPRAHANPRSAEVYNIGGGRFSNCSMIEAIALCEEISGHELDWKYVDDNRAGDHIWWISDLSKFRSHYPDWAPVYDVETILRESYDYNRNRWSASKKAVTA